MKKFGLLVLMISSAAMAGGNRHKIFEAHFLDRMIDHHEEAIDMAELAEAKSSNPEVKALSAHIAKDQKKEIRKMKGWRKEYYPDVPPAAENGDLVIPDLQTVSGKSFDKRYLQAMTDHHEEAAKMFNEAADKAERNKIQNFAEDGLKEEMTEIKQMKTLRTNL